MFANEGSSHMDMSVSCTTWGLLSVSMEAEAVAGEDGRGRGAKADDSISRQKNEVACRYPKRGSV